jgi:hypothetical protein
MDKVVDIVLSEIDHAQKDKFCMFASNCFSEPRECMGKGK